MNKIDFFKIKYIYGNKFFLLYIYTLLTKTCYYICWLFIIINSDFITLKLFYHYIALMVSLVSIHIL